MPSISVSVDTDDLSRLNKRLSRFIHKSEHLAPVMEEAAQYMKRATENRILRSKKGPAGERWAALSDVTADLKGHDEPLFASGELSRSIHVMEANGDGFMITSDAPYASYMQKGVKTIRGAFRSQAPSPQVPARPFLGFSDENIRRISKMIIDYIEKGG